MGGMFVRSFIKTSVRILSQKYLLGSRSIIGRLAFQLWRDKVISALELLDPSTW